MTNTPWRRVAFVAAVVLVVLAITAAVLLRGRTRAAAPQQAPTVFYTVRPKDDPDFKVWVTNPADVHGYYRIDLEAQVPGVVDYLVKDFPDRVAQGEALLTLSVPDLEADIAVKRGQLADRKRELEVYGTREEVAAKAIDTADHMLEEAKQNVIMARSDWEFRKVRADRFDKLANTDLAATKDIADETRAEAQKAAAGYYLATASEGRAKAELAEAKAKLEEARADTKLRQSEVERAKSELEKAKALRSFAVIRAPWDGFIAGPRHVDPGAFVSNASSGHSDPLLTLERTDILTVSANFPDTYAPYIQGPTAGEPGTEFKLTIPELPGVIVKGHVTRVDRTVETPANDRTMRVEVDLFMATDADYQLLERWKATRQDLLTMGATEAGMVGSTFGQGPLLSAAGLCPGRFQEVLKGDAMPIQPTVTQKASLGSGSPLSRLKPGMFGDMRLALRDFPNAYLLPSTAVFSRGGERYIYLVKDGAAVLTPVEVPVEQEAEPVGDAPKAGRRVIEALVLVKEPNGGTRALGPDDEVVAADQGELLESRQDVKTWHVEW
ncbi:MAG TPA: HlyD family efflux transporter periplasmic adaptor subunit [Gemmataceae bacterium]|nr:HlyD family efflux transporter periplasmic adaptor subunit [Gemmataceae bacterium]